MALAPVQGVVDDDPGGLSGVVGSAVFYTWLAPAVSPTLLVRGQILDRQDMDDGHFG